MSNAPSGPDVPNLWRQESLDERRPRYHLLVSGDHCPTEFFTDRWFWHPPVATDLYADMTKAVNHVNTKTLYHTGPSQVLTWDWWNIHRAMTAKRPGWRFLIRVTESDWLEPQTDLRQVIRLHNPVYVPSQFGW